jgi:hypothetical protein
MVGIGEPEAIRDLTREMNELRTSRRDNAKLVLQRPFAYFDGLLDPGDIAFGPGVGVPVTGDPREVIFPLPLQDIPASSYQEEARLQADIERVTGIDDSVSGGSGSPQGAAATATGAQLVQAAAGVRIQNKTRRLLAETVAPGTSQFHDLNRQYITEQKEVLGPPLPGGADQRWAWYEIGPEELAGEYTFEPEDGSTEPENIVQKREDLRMFAEVFAQNPLVDPRLVTKKMLELAGVENPEGWMAPEDPQVPAHALEMVGEALRELAQEDPMELASRLATDPEFFNELVAGAAGAAEEGGLPPEEGGGPPGQPPAGQNGAGPQQQMGPPQRLQG